MNESFFSSTFKQVLKHELLVCGKVSCFLFAVQLIFQLIPLQHSPILAILSWIVFPVAIIIGFRSDMRFYTSAVDNTVRFERLCCNLCFLLTSWIVTIYLFQYLNLPWNPDIQKNSTEDEGPGSLVPGAGLILEEIIESVGFVKGLTLLLFAHFAAVVTLVSFVRTVVFGLENVIMKMAAWLPVPLSARFNKSGSGWTATWWRKKEVDREKKPKGN